MTGPDETFHAYDPVQAVEVLLNTWSSGGRYVTIVDANHTTVTTVKLAELIAATVLDAADYVTELRSRPAPLEIWERDERFRDHIRADVQRELLAGIVAKGGLPVELPRELVTYRVNRWNLVHPKGEPINPGELFTDRDVAVSIGRSYGGVDVILRVFCRIRIPDVEREAQLRDMVPPHVRDRIR